MSDLYSVTRGQQSARDLADAMHDTIGELPAVPGVFPDHAAPIVRAGAEGVRELTLARSGMPGPEFALQGRKTGKGVGNVSDTASAHLWRGLDPDDRSVVLFNSFSDNARTLDGKIAPEWFGLEGERPLAFFVGVRTVWTCTRTVGEVECELSAFPTTDANAEVGAIRPKAAPVNPTKSEEVEAWPSTPWPEAGRLQRPLSGGMLKVVSRGGRKDESPALAAGLTAPPESGLAIVRLTSA